MPSAPTAESPGRSDPGAKPPVASFTAAGGNPSGASPCSRLGGTDVLGLLGYTLPVGPGA